MVTVPEQLALGLAMLSIGLCALGVHAAILSILWNIEKDRKRK